MILRGLQQPVRVARDEGHHAQLVAIEELLHHHHIARRAEDAPLHHVLDGPQRFGLCLRDDHALARRNAVGLHHHRRTVPLDVGPRRRRIREGLVPRRRDARPRHDLLGERLAPLKLRRFPPWTHHAQPRLSEAIGQPQGEWRLRPYDREIDPLRLRERQQPRRVIHLDRRATHQHAILARAAPRAHHARIARRDNDLGPLRTSRQRPGNCMLAGTPAHDQYLRHGHSLPQRSCTQS